MNKASMLTIVMLALLTNNLTGKTIVIPKDAANIQAGIEKSQPGDTVFVLKGIYRESIVLREEISLIGESVTQTVIQGNGKDPAVKVADKVTC